MPHNQNITNTASNPGDPPWTTGRCNRLLRPLTTQLKVLREIVYPQLHASVVPSQASLSGHGSAPSSKGEAQEDHEGHHVGRHKSFDDPDWMPDGPEKRGNKRMYTSRPPKTNALVAPDARKPGEISMPSPLIARQVKFEGSSHPPAEQSTGWKFLQTPKKRRFPMLKHVSGPDLLRESTGQQLRHIERFLQAFRGLLQATNPTKHPRESKSGTRSLMSTCLRRVPAYIDGRQQWEDEENVEKVNVSDEIYQQLEDMGTASGWRPLREVVRAHGVALVATAIAENLLDTNSIEQLVRQCYQALAFDEAEDILSTFAFTSAPLPPPKSVKDELIQFDDPRFRGLAAAHAWAERTDGWPFFYRLIRSMLATDLFPIEWTSTAKFKQIWSRVIRNISDSKSPAHAEACKLFHTVLSTACGISATDPDETLSAESRDDGSAHVPISIHKALNTTVSSLSAIFAAIFLLPDMEASYGRDGRHAIQHALENTASEIAHNILNGHLDTMVSHSRFAVERLSNIITCAIIAGVKSDEHPPHIAASPITTYIKALTRVEEITRRQLLNLPAIACSVAETCGKSYSPKSPENVFQVLKSIVVDLKSYRISSTDDGKFTSSTLSSDWETTGFPSWFLKRLALDLANEFADHRQDSIGNSRECFQFALQVENEMQRIQMPQHDTPFFHKDTNYHVGYRWESGISEWVEAAPSVFVGRPSRRKSASTILHSRTESEAEGDDDEVEGEGEEQLPSSPLKASTPARRPTLSQLLLANMTPDVLANTPVAAALSKSTPTVAPTTPAFSSTPVVLKSLRKNDYEDDEDDEFTTEDDADELAPTSPVQHPPSSPAPPPRKRARQSGGSGGGSSSNRPVTTFSAAFGLDGADDSDDELSFL